MILDIKPLMRSLRGVDLAAAPPALLRAVGGLAYLLAPRTDEALRVAYAASDQAASRFAAAGTPEERETWLDALLHFTPREALFGNTADDGEYEALLARCRETEARMVEGIRPLLDGSAQPFDGLPLTECLRRLETFFRQDINSLSGGDDARARALLTAADREFERCREELFAYYTTDTESYILYYHVLCAVRPDHTSADNVRHYHQYFSDFGEHFLAEEDAALCWSFREIRLHHRLSLDSHDDRTALAGLWLALPESCAAFRCQLYRWHLELDPYDDFSAESYAHKANYASEGLRRLGSWLTAKQRAGIPVPAERQAELLLAYALVQCIAAVESPLGDYFFGHAYDVLDSLRPSRRKTHLKVRMAALLDDDELLAEARAETGAWSPSSLTEEDRYLLEELSLEACLIEQMK